MDIAEAQRVLAASPDHRVLKRVPPVSEWPTKAVAAETRRAVFLDVETTGLDQDVDEVIELAMVSFDYDKHTGEIVRVDEAVMLSSFRQPSLPIPEASRRVHGIKDADVAGAVIDGARIEAILGEAQLAIAHNASFDRPMVEKHWPAFAKMHWACSLEDIDWAGEGVASGKLDYILFRQGWFHDGHRAKDDALAALFLISQTLPVSGVTGLGALLAKARKPLMAVRAEGTPFELREALKQRGYRWDAGAGQERDKAWWILTEDANAEIAWLNAKVYPQPKSLTPIPMQATRRYSTRLWST